MRNSPFVYGNTVSKSSFTNRELESDKLKSNLLNGINTSIISPRRWGKSSLVEKVILEINKEEPEFKTVIIDLFSINGEEEFLERYAREIIKASSNRIEDWVKSGKEFLQKLIPQISFGIDPTTDFSLSFNWKELKKHSQEVLDLPEKIAQKRSIRFIVCLDEFQNLANYSDFENFEKKLRSVWQRHKNVTYCLYGSKRHMMSDIFNNPSKPFYRFGDIILLQKIKNEKWVKFISDSFKQTGKIIPNNLAEHIAKTMENHSWYVQQLAHYTWNYTEKKVDLEIIEKAINELLLANSPFYQQQVESLSVTQLNLLKAILNGEKQLTSQETMHNFRLGTPNNVNKNKSKLINEDVISIIDGKYEFLDPAFKLWLRKVI